MSAPAVTLAPFEVPIRRGGTSFARFEPVRIHRETHRATGVAPFEAGVDEHPREPFLFGLPLNQTGAGNDHRLADARRDLSPAHHRRRGAQVFDARVSAGANEHAVELDLGKRAPRLQPHVRPARAQQTPVVRRRHTHSDPAPVPKFRRRVPATFPT